MTPPPPDPKLHTLVIRARELQSRHRYYRIAVDSFLDWLYTEFPKVRRLSELRRDPHLLGWISCLANQQPPLANETRRIYITVLRRLLRDLAWENRSALPELILRGDFPPRLSHRKLVCAPLLQRSPFQDVFDAHLGFLATTRRPGTMTGYRQIANHFLSWLQTHFPELRELSELRRDPHLLGWLRCLCEQHSPLSNRTRRGWLYLLRRLLNDLAAQGHLQPGLILLEDFPPEPRYLPRPIPLDQDQGLQQELRRTNDWLCNALLLTRATGIRIGECIDLAKDCLRLIGEDQWALHVPLGKLHTERLVPVDDSVRNIVARILELRQQEPPPRNPQSLNFLLPRSTPRCTYQNLRLAIRAAAERAGCPNPITCHQLRHTYATEMLRLGVSLPALMQLLGHKTIAMTLRYAQVTQQDLQREYHLALQNAAQRHFIPRLFTTDSADSAATHDPGLDGVRRALGAARHLLEIHRRDLTDKKSQRHLQRLENRLVAVALELERLGAA